MASIPHILVAVKDPWARSLPAADKAVQLARSLSAEVRLFHALTDPVLVDVREMQDLAKLERDRRERVLARLNLVAKRLRRSVTVTVAAEWDFPAYEAVIRAAQRFRAALIVAELHPTSHRIPRLLRFTDIELLRFSPAPVLLVKTRQPYVSPAVLAAVDPSRARAKPEGLDAQIVHYGSTVARALHGKLHAIHAFNPLPVGGALPDFGTIGTVAEIGTAARTQARAALDRTVRSAAVARSRTHLVARHPVDAIGEVAGEIGAGIVVMGAISRSGIKRLAIGNTAEKVLDRLSCDVLVVKPKDFRNRIPMALRGAQLIAHSGVQAGY